MYVRSCGLLLYVASYVRSCGAMRARERRAARTAPAASQQQPPPPSGVFVNTGGYRPHQSRLAPPSVGHAATM
eukprot:COSAG01_NODE_25721_length_735_cov_3.655660_1_plen_72_part_10